MLVRAALRLPFEIGEAAEQRGLAPGGDRGAKDLAQGKQPADGRGSDTEPGDHADPIGGCALDRRRVQTACYPTFDPREELGSR